MFAGVHDGVCGFAKSVGHIWKTLHSEAGTTGSQLIDITNDMFTALQSSYTWFAQLALICCEWSLSSWELKQADRGAWL